MTTRTLWPGVVLGGLMIGGIGTAVAEGDSGFYMQADMGSGRYPKRLSIDGAAPLLTRGPTKQNDFAWAFAAGYHFNSYLAAELGFADLGAVTTKLVDASGATTNRGQVRVAARGKSLSLLAHLPSGNWDPYFKAGLMQAVVSRRVDGQAVLLDEKEIQGFNYAQQHESLKAVLGIGVRYAFTDQWAINAAVDYYPGLAKDSFTNGVGDVISPRVGFAYRF